MTLSLRLALLGLAAAAVPGAAPAQNYPQLSAARAAGLVGERFDGYLGFARTPSSAVRSQVSAVNIRRRALYVGLASRRGVTPQIAGIATGCELLRNLAVGEVYMLQDGVWRQRGRGQPPPQPDHCG